jgi:integrase
MPRQRKDGAGLPARVYVKHGAYYFCPRDPMRDPRDPASKVKKSWLLLCRVDDGKPKMYAELAKVLDERQLIEGSMPFACAEFKANKLGEYTDTTREDYGRYLDLIAAVFEDFHAGQVATKDCADFLRAKFKGKANTARKVAALMAKLFRFIIGELGLRQDNPMDQIDLGAYKTQRRTVLPTHAQIAAIRAAGMQSKERSDTGATVATASGPMFACIIDMSYLLWARAIDVRTLKESQIVRANVDGRQVDTHIRIKPSKTEKTSGKMVDIAITPQIAAVIERARAIKKQYEVISPYLFPTQKGGAYTKSGLHSMWRRAKDRAEIKDDVTFKDIRALGATDAAKRGEDRKSIQTRLAHTTGKTTDIYIKEVVPDVSDIAVTLPWAEK